MAPTFIRNRYGYSIDFDTVVRSMDQDLLATARSLMDARRRAPRPGVTFDEQWI